MTVSKLREYMLEKLIPEKVMPQNIMTFLMDEEAELPELDAFTFLNRLRALGIGSADFLYLLKGCGAPREAVEKIEQNPAMNLQKLIVTLEGSGLTPQDYTRMLYTARQLWERTLTMRLEAETGERSIIDEASAEDIDYPQAYSGNAEAEPAPCEQELSEFPDITQGDESCESDEEIQGGAVQLAEETPLPEPKNVPDGTGEFIAVTADSFHIEIPDDDNDAVDEAAEEPETADEPDEAFVFEPQERDERSEIRENSPFRLGAVVASAIGAAVLFVLSAVLGATGFEQLAEVIEAHYAADSAEIFGEIYSSYNSGILGGNNVCAMPSERLCRYGGLLVKSGGQLGVYSQGDIAYAAEKERIEVYRLADGELTYLSEINPPNGCEFIRVFEQDGGVFAVFSGEVCGFTRLENGAAKFVSSQDGILTDISLGDGFIRFGSVYVPGFTESFSVEQDDHFLPAIGVGERSVIPPQSVLVSGEAGCGYAISVCYDLADGAPTECSAVLGNPVYASADGNMAVLMTDGGSMLYGRGQQLVSEPEDELVTEAAGEVFACDYDNNGLLATAERTENGVVVNLRARGLTPIAVLANFGGEISALELEDGILYIIGADGGVTAMNCTDPHKPEAVELTAATGTVRGEYALCEERTPSGIRFVLYGETEDGISELASYTKNLTAEELSTLETGGANTMYIGGADCCGVCYSYFDGVSVVSEYSLFGKQRKISTLFDDKEGFVLAAGFGEDLYLKYSGGTLVP